MQKITSRHLEIYRAYNGDEDAFNRTASDAEHQAMPESLWFAIIQLIQQLVLIERGLASADYAKAIEERLDSTVADARTAAALRDLATKPE